jgi:hypothetical protein
LSDGVSGQQAFVVSETNGAWGKAEKVPGIAAISKGSQAQVSSVSCASVGKCGAGGFYTGHSAPTGHSSSARHDDHPRTTAAATGGENPACGQPPRSRISRISSRCSAQ